MGFKEKIPLHYNKDAEKRLEFSVYFIEEFSKMQLFMRLYWVLP